MTVYEYVFQTYYYRNVFKIIFYAKLTPEEKHNPHLLDIASFRLFLFCSINSYGTGGLT